MTKYLKIIAQYSFTIFLTIFIACNASKPQENNAACQFVGTVKDMRGLDGCQFLIITESGEKLLPTRVPEGFTLQGGQEIKFGYQEAEAMASICMAEDKTVEVTCIELLNEESTQKQECLNIENAIKVDWMVAAIDQYAPLQIVKYRYRTNSWAYLFKGKKHYLYDCQGTLICESEDTSSSRCMSKIGANKVGVVIWQGEGVND